jgi:hypothetical protein
MEKKSAAKTAFKQLSKRKSVSCSFLKDLTVDQWEGEAEEISEEIQAIEDAIARFAEKHAKYSVLCNIVGFDADDKFVDGRVWVGGYKPTHEFMSIQILEHADEVDDKDSKEVPLNGCDPLTLLG